eukprot:5706496-Prymnesium_polylepis.1
MADAHQLLWYGFTILLCSFAVKKSHVRASVRGGASAVRPVWCLAPPGAVRAPREFIATLNDAGGPCWSYESRA